MGSCSIIRATKTLFARRIFRISSTEILTLNTGSSGREKLLRRELKKEQTTILSSKFTTGTALLTSLHRIELTAMSSDLLEAEIRFSQDITGNFLKKKTMSCALVKHELCNNVSYDVVLLLQNTIFDPLSALTYNLIWKK